MSDSGRSTTYASGHSGHSEGEKSEKETAENKVSTTRRSSSSLGIGSRVARIINATTGAVASAANIKVRLISDAFKLNFTSYNRFMVFEVNK